MQPNFSLPQKRNQLHTLSPWEPHRGAHLHLRAGASVAKGQTHTPINHLILGEVLMTARIEKTISSVTAEVQRDFEFRLLSFEEG